MAEITATRRPRRRACLRASVRRAAREHGSWPRNRSPSRPATRRPARTGGQPRRADRQWAPVNASATGSSARLPARTRSSRPPGDLLALAEDVGQVQSLFVWSGDGSRSPTPAAGGTALFAQPPGGRRRVPRTGLDLIPVLEQHVRHFAGEARWTTGTPASACSPTRPSTAVPNDERCRRVRRRHRSARLAGTAVVPASLALT